MRSIPRLRVGLVQLDAAYVSDPQHGRDCVPACFSFPSHVHRAASLVPTLRHAINSATMLTAISGTVCEPML
jgi:hypothetical protein